MHRNNRDDGFSGVYDGAPPRRTNNYDGRKNFQQPNRNNVRYQNAPQAQETVYIDVIETRPPKKNGNYTFFPSAPNGGQPSNSKNIHDRITFGQPQLVGGYKEYIQDQKGQVVIEEVIVQPPRHRNFSDGYNTEYHQHHQRNNQQNSSTQAPYNAHQQPYVPDKVKRSPPAYVNQPVQRNYENRAPPSGPSHDFHRGSGQRWDNNQRGSKVSNWNAQHDDRVVKSPSNHYETSSSFGSRPEKQQTVRENPGGLTEALNRMRLQKDPKGSHGHSEPRINDVNIEKLKRKIQEFTKDSSDSIPDQAKAWSDLGFSKYGYNLFRFEMPLEDFHKDAMALLHSALQLPLIISGDMDISIYTYLATLLADKTFGRNFSDDRSVNKIRLAIVAEEDHTLKHFGNLFGFYGLRTTLINAQFDRNRAIGNPILLTKSHLMEAIEKTQALDNLSYLWIISESKEPKAEINLAKSCKSWFSKLQQRAKAGGNRFKTVLSCPEDNQVLIDTITFKTNHDYLKFARNDDGRLHSASSLQKQRGSKNGEKKSPQSPPPSFLDTSIGIEQRAAEDLRPEPLPVQPVAEANKVEESTPAKQPSEEPESKPVSKAPMGLFSFSKQPLGKVALEPTRNPETIAAEPAKIPETTINTEVPPENPLNLTNLMD